MNESRCHKTPPQPNHIAGTNKGEELALGSKEAGRGQGKDYRTARDATGVCPDARNPIHPDMPHLPPG